MFALTHPGQAETRRFQRIFVFLVVLSIFSASFSAPLQASKTPDKPARCERYYVVSSGERLSQVGARYGFSAQALAEANGLSIHFPLKHGYVLCIPYRPLDWYYPKATLYATASFNRITVWGTGFPEEHRFNIRIKAYLGSKTRKVGNVLIDEDGEFQAFPRIPKEFLKARTLEVCLKDNNDSYRICTRVSRGTGSRSDGF